jgi:Cation transporting ATPase, C-terminus
MVFAAIALMQEAVALECRATPASLFSVGPLGNRLLDAALAVELLALAAFVYAPPAYHVLGQHPLSAAQWLPIAVSPLLLLAAEEGRKALVRRRQNRRSLPSAAMRPGGGRPKVPGHRP